VLDTAFPELPPCTSHNLPRRLVDKLLSGDGTPLDDESDEGDGGGGCDLGAAPSPPLPFALLALIVALARRTRRA
jgi:MYXO-CTERM domain-containing protein